MGLKVNCFGTSRADLILLVLIKDEGRGPLK
jgi:hypothetical protein